MPETYILRDINHRPVTIPKATYDALIKQTAIKPYYILAVYSFYYYAAIWQKTNKPKATTRFISQGLKMSVTNVCACRKQLKKMKLIEDVLTTDKTGQRKGYYVLVRYYEGDLNFENSSNNPLSKIETPGSQDSKKPGGGFLDTNAYSNGNINLSGKSRSMESTKTPLLDNSEKVVSFEEICANRLFKMLVKKKKILRNKYGNIVMNSHAWREHFSRLRNEFKKKRITSVLSWYCKHIEDKFVPQAYAAKSFRDKFFAIENAMKRQQDEEKGKSTLEVSEKNGVVTKSFVYVQEDVD